MKFPDFYQPAQVGRLFIPETARAVEAGRSAGLKPAERDSRRVLLMLVDMQVDFIHPDGALSVPGAVEDTRRTLEWIFRNAADITTIAASLDSHVPIQIFSPTWWANADGQHPAPYTVVRSDEVASGRWTPLYEPEWSREYTAKLEEQAKKELMIWPYHTLIGTPGHALTPALYEAIAYHSAARHAQPVFLSKGSIPKTEHYSMLEPEVKVTDQPLGVLNVPFLDLIASYDRVYIAGQAKSHCVLETVTSMMRYFGDQPEVIGKLRVLTDAMSSVAHPTIDFEAMATATFGEFQQRGLTLTKTSETLD